MTTYSNMTEISGDAVTSEQVIRCCSRYNWAYDYCANKDVLEVACGSGFGVQYLAGTAKSFSAGDIDSDLLAIAQKANEGFELQNFSAEELPYSDNSLDIIICFEAIYYFDFERFLLECKRVLRKGGKLLLATANPDLYDFNPSPFSKKYYGVVSLHDLLTAHGFQGKYFGDCPLAPVSLLQRLLRPVKKIVVSLGLMPKTMAGKKMLKRLIFGSLVNMPAVLTKNMMTNVIRPTPITLMMPDTQHKVIFCEATLL